MEEFRNSTGMRIFYSVTALIMIGVAVSLLTSDHPQTNNAVLLLPIALLVFAFSIIATQIKYKIVISADSIVKINVLGKKELLTANIKGCRIGQKVISIEPMYPSDPKIVINNYPDLGNSGDLITWLTENFTDLDADDLKQEHERLLTNSTLGVTIEEREKRLTTARYISIGYTALGLPAGFILLLANNHLTMVLALLYPLTGMAIMLTSKGLIRFISDRKRSTHGFIFLGFAIPAFTLFLNAIGNYDIYQYQNALIPLAVVCVAVFLILFKRGLNETMPITGQLVTMFIVSALYGYGSVIQVNCAFDVFAPQVVQTTVQDMDITYHKGTHYYLKLNPWTAESGTKSVQVSDSTFNRYKVGSSINVNLKKGTLNIPWFYIR